MDACVCCVGDCFVEAGEAAGEVEDVVFQCCDLSWFAEDGDAVGGGVHPQAGDVVCLCPQGGKCFEEVAVGLVPEGSDVFVECAADCAFESDAVFSCVVVC